MITNNRQTAWIKNHLIQFIRHEQWVFKVVVFEPKKESKEFIVSLQPSGDDTILPFFQLYSKDQSIPECIKGNLKDISDLIINRYNLKEKE